MLSEKWYWIILILGLGLFSAATLFWILPYARDVAVNLLSGSLFTIFTIVFLTWLIRKRENDSWKLVEKRVLYRISTHLYKIFDNIYLYFLQPAPRMSKQLEEQFAKAEKMDYGLKRERLIDVILVEFYASQEQIMLGNETDGMVFLQNPDLEAATGFKSDFEKERDFLEHIITEYSKFISPVLMNSIMQIEDGLEGIILVCDRIISIDLPSMKQDHSDLFANITRDNVRILADAIHKITKEIDKLNKKGLGLSKYFISKRLMELYTEKLGIGVSSWTSGDFSLSFSFL